MGVKLPTISMLSRQAQAISEKNFTEALEKSTNMEELEVTLKEQISKELLKNYGQKALVKTRVERDIEKNITVQSLQEGFVPDNVLIELNRDKMTNKTTEKKARKIMDIRDTSTEHMRSDELKRFRSLISRLDPIISREDQGNLEPKRQKILEGIDEER